MAKRTKGTTAKKAKVSKSKAKTSKVAKANEEAVLRLFRPIMDSMDEIAAKDDLPAELRLVKVHWAYRHFLERMLYEEMHDKPDLCEEHFSIDYDDYEDEFDAITDHIGGLETAQIEEILEEVYPAFRKV